MEQFRLPLREIRRLYTKSELAIMAWRSSEMAANMERRAARPESPETSHAEPAKIRVAPSTTRLQIVDPEFAALDERLAPIADKMVNAEGDIDLRQLTGAEAIHYMRSMGIPIGGAF